MIRFAATLGLWVGLVPLAWAGSETPPEGPPWQRVLLDAQKQALEEGKPLFVYFTKTY